MKNATIFLSLFGSAMLTSCAGVSPTRVIGDTAGATGGALVGHALSKSNPLITAASAGAGVLLSETLQGASNASAKKSYTEGYEKGRSDSSLSSTSSVSDRNPTMRPTFAYSKCRCRNANRTASFSHRAPPPFEFRNNTFTSMKLIISITTLLVAASLANAQVVVIDPTAIAHNQANHVVDLAKYVEMVNNQIRQINTMTQELQQVTAYVKAFGDPSKLLNIVGANQLIGSLQQTGVGQTLTQLQRSANGLQALQYNGNGLYQSLGQTFTTPNGAQFPRLEDLYRKYGAIQDDSRNFQSVTNDVFARRKTLRDQIAATTEKLQASTTDAETQKLNGVITGYNAELSTVDHEIDNAAAQVATQDAENRADRERQEQARREERQAQMEEGLQQYGEVFRLETTPPSFPTSH